MKITINIALTLIVGLALFAITRSHPSNGLTSIQIMGRCLMAVGFVFWTVARFQLGNSLTVSAQARQLVTRGLYSKIRNPIYVFGSTIIAGLILARGRPIWLLVFVLIIPLQLWRAGKESQVLETVFGEEYRKYRASTWF
jgi:protein-S-isoprenylcysteine O-methyltransferase Ste14